jgi:hypothetical protein
MDSDHFHFKDRLKDIENFFINKGWITIYDNSENVLENQHLIFCCLVDDSRICSYREKTDWVIDPGQEGKPSIIGNFNSGTMEYAYHRFADEGIEPFVFLRSFPQHRDCYIDVSEDFVSYFKLYEKLKDKQNRTYYFTDDLGELVEVLKIEPNVVKVKQKFLMEFISIRKMHVSICFDFMSLANSKTASFEIAFQDTVSKKEKIIYSNLIRHLSLGVDDLDLQSWIRGKAIISYDEDKVNKYYFEVDGLYEEFITGYDEMGDHILTSCKKEDSKLFVLTYFKKEVLDKYYNDPEKYKVTGWHISCSSFSLKIDNNVEEYVPVFLVELANLPHREQLHWKQYNLGPQKGMSRSYYTTMIKGNWVKHPEAPDLFFKQRYSEFNKNWRDKFGWSFYRPLSGEDKHNFDSLHIPTTNSIKSFCEQVLAFVKITIDSLNENEISRGVALDENDKAIAKLEKFLELKQTPIPAMIEFLRNLQALRSGLIAHRFSESNRNVKRALEYFNLGNDNRTEVARNIFINGIWSMNSLERYLIDQIEIKTPDELTDDQFSQLLDLIESGDQIPNIKQVQVGLRNADKIGIIRRNNIIISTATIKNPADSYRRRVFNDAGVPELKENFGKELGYICTRSEHEGRKLCQQLLRILLDGAKNIYATTRQASMVHILNKFGFVKSGHAFKTLSN